MSCRWQQMPRVAIGIAAWVLSAWLVAPEIVAAEPSSVKRAILPEDLYALREIPEIRVSPTGKAVVFVMSSFDATSGSESSNLWLLSTAAAAPVQLTRGEFKDSTPRWSPDGKYIAFASNREAGNALWLLDVATHAIRKVAPWPQRQYFISKAGEALAWAPDGSEIAFVAADRATAGSSPDPRVISSLRFKTRTGYVDDAHAQIFAARVGDGRVRQLTHGNYDAHSISWSSKGELAFLANSAADAEQTFHYDIYVLDPSTGQPRKLSDATGVAYSPAWSPDGSTIAYIATTRPVTTIDSVAEDTHVWTIDRSGTSRQLTDGLDRRAGAPQWTPDGKTLLFAAPNQGEMDIYSVSSRGGPVRSVVQGPTAVRTFSIGGPTLAFTRTSDDQPVEIWLAGADGSRAHAATSLNTELSHQWRLAAPQTFWYSSADQTRIQGWIMPPEPRADGQRYPLILSIHGGPHNMFGYGFDWSNQVWASRGYGILYLNPRGSLGYGQKFADGSLNDWGGADYQDLMSGVDFAIAHFPWVDPKRLAVTGLSYGGYMTNWILTRNERFRAAVSMSGLSNLISFYGTSLYQDLVHAEFGGRPWDRSVYETLWSRSPLARISSANTPLLLTVGEQDNDVPNEQSEEMFTALRMRGVDAMLVKYPREGHVLHEPRHRIDQLNRTLDWFDQHLSR